MIFLHLYKKRPVQTIHQIILKILLYHRCTIICKNSIAYKIKKIDLCIIFYIILMCLMNYHKKFYLMVGKIQKQQIILSVIIKQYGCVTHGNIIFGEITEYHLKVGFVGLETKLSMVMLNYINLFGNRFQLMIFCSFLN